MQKVHSDWYMDMTLESENSALKLRGICWSMSMVDRQHFQQSHIIISSSDGDDNHVWRSKSEPKSWTRHKVEPQYNVEACGNCVKSKARGRCETELSRLQQYETPSGATHYITDLDKVLMESRDSLSFDVISLGRMYVAAAAATNRWIDVKSMCGTKAALRLGVILTAGIL